MLRKILFITNHPPGAIPSQSFRFEEYIIFLEQQGISCEVSPILNYEESELFYKKGYYGRKLCMLLKGVGKRIKDVCRAGKFDVIFVHREAIFLGTAIFEWLFSKSKAKLVYDFDDALWIPDISEANEAFGWLKRPAKTNRIIAMADLVIAGNSFLAEHSSRLNPTVRMIPVTVDTEKYKRLPRSIPNNEGTVVIGWIGTPSNIKYFEMLLPVIAKLRARYGERILFRVVSKKRPRKTMAGIEHIFWRKEEEIQWINSFDIGVMPLFHDEWCKGKCAAKLLQYMSMEIASVATDTGSAVEIIEHGESGFLAHNENDWEKYLSMLIENATLRQEIGKNARSRVVTAYSIQANKYKYLEAINSLFYSFMVFIHLYLFYKSF